MQALTIHKCGTCGKLFAFSFASWSPELIDEMRKEMKEHFYYCEKNEKWIEDMKRHYKICEV